MLIKPKSSRAGKGLSKTSLYNALGWQKLWAFQLWNENALMWLSCSLALARSGLLGALLSFLHRLFCDTPGRWLEGKEAERPVSDFAPHVSERGRSLSHFTKSISILSWYFTHLRSE